MAGVIFDGKLVAPAILVEKEVPSTEWQPDPEWPDIEKIVEENTDNYAVKIGVVLYGAGDVSVLSTITVGNFSKILTSDGAEYSIYSTSPTHTHTWDTSKDIDDGTGLPVRYLILMSASVDSYSSSMGQFQGPIDNLYPAYIYIKGSYSKGWSHAFSGNPLLQNVKINGTVTISNYGAFANDISLAQVPKNISWNFSGSTGVPFTNCPSITDMSSLVLQENFPGGDGLSWIWPGVSIMPDCVLATKPKDLSFVDTSVSAFTSLIKIPDGWDLSQCTNFGRTFYSAPNLMCAGTVDMSANTASFSSARSPFNVPKLREIKCTLPSNTNVWFNISTTISIESFRFMADHAPDVTATPRTLTIGSTNISRINVADPTIITDLNARGWTVA